MVDLSSLVGSILLRPGPGPRCTLCSALGLPVDQPCHSLDGVCGMGRIGSSRLQLFDRMRTLALHLILSLGGGIR